MVTAKKPEAKSGAKRAPSKTRSSAGKKSEQPKEKKLFRPSSSMPMYTDGMLNIAVKAAREAARIQLMAFKDTSRLSISRKSLGDYVTEVDKECERVITETLKTAFPTHAVIGEESGASGVKDAEYTWVIDPLDGTTNFIHGIDQFAVSIALLKNNVPLHGVVYDTCRNQLFTATKGHGAFLDARRIRVSNQSSLSDALLATGFPFREDDDYEAAMPILLQLMKNTCGIRRPGSAALDLCWTACGRFDGYWEKGIKIWDIAAGALIAREAGAIVTDYSGEGDFLTKGEIVAATPKVYVGMMEVIQPKTA